MRVECQKATMCDPATENKTIITTNSGEMIELTPESCWDPATFQEHKYVIWSGQRSTGKSYLGLVLKQFIAEPSAIHNSANDETKK